MVGIMFLAGSMLTMRAFMNIVEVCTMQVLGVVMARSDTAAVL